MRLSRTSVGETACVARLTLHSECSMKQAYAVARWFDMFMAFYLTPAHIGLVELPPGSFILVK